MRNHGVINGPVAVFICNQTIRLSTETVVDQREVTKSRWCTKTTNETKSHKKKPTTTNQNAGYVHVRDQRSRKQALSRTNIVLDTFLANKSKQN